MQSPRRFRQWVRASLAAVMPRQLYLVSGPTHERSVCLTFDDGPHPVYTARVLDVLKRHGVRATFFVIGREAARYPDLVRRMAAEGHEVGSHSFSHSEPALTSARQFLDETRRTTELLTAPVGEAPRLCRPPHGKVTARKLLGLWRARQTVVLWNADPKDFARTSHTEILDWFAQRPLRGGDLVLLHDPRPVTAQALPDILTNASRSRLRFVTVGEWLGRSRPNCIRAAEPLTYPVAQSIR